MKYVFLDSNVYRHFYDSNEDALNKVAVPLSRLLESKKIKLCVPQQVIDEVERNSCHSWCYSKLNSLSSKITDNTNKLDILEKNFKGLSGEKGLRRAIEMKIKKLEKEKEIVEKRYKCEKSDANKAIAKIFELATVIDETEAIIADTHLRVAKGNPPADKQEKSSFGDCLIWESLLKEFSNKTDTELIFIAADDRAWGKSEFNNWLKKEWAKNTHKTNKIIFESSLSKIPELTQQEQGEIEEEEKERRARYYAVEKMRAVLRFTKSDSLKLANIYFKRLEKFIDGLEEEDWSYLIAGILRNIYIRESSFVKERMREFLEEKSEIISRAIGKDQKKKLLNFLEEGDFVFTDESEAKSLENVDF